jgi:hypothetical protein
MEAKMKKYIIILAVSLFGLVTNVIAAEALFGQWLLDDGSGTTAADTSGYGNDAVLSGNQDWGTDYFTFDGSSHFVVDHTADDFLIDMSKSFRIEASIKLSYESTSMRSIFSRHNNVWEPGGKNLFVNGDGKLQWDVGWVGGFAGTTVVADDTWWDVAVEYDASTTTVTLYVEGYDDGSMTMDLGSQPDGFDIYFGTMEGGFGIYNGAMKNIRVYQEVTKAYSPNPNNGDTGVDSSLSQVVWQTPDSNYTYNVYFDTNESLVTASDIGVKIASGTSNLFAPVSVVPGNTYYWKVDCIVPPPDGNVIEGDTWSFSTVSYEAYDPSPYNGEQFVSIYGELSWQSGLGATGHQVYFSDNFDEVDNLTVAPQSTSSAIFDPPVTLKLGTPYWWRVKETGGPMGDVIGPVWGFIATPDEVIENFNYFNDAELHAKWVGVPQDNYKSDDYSHISMVVPYGDYNQVYTRTFVQDMDFSTAANLTIDYRINIDAASQVAPVRIKLLNNNDDVLLTATLTDPVLGEFTRWNIPIYNQGVDLSAVRKVTIEVDAAASWVSPDGMYFDELVLRLPVCTGAIPADVNGDCQVNFVDFANMAADWLSCNRVPAEACFSY